MKQSRDFRENTYGRYGIRFSLTRLWRRLFSGRSHFVYQRPYNQDEICLARFTLWNVLRWYFYQAVIFLVYLVMSAVCRLADRYRRLQEGETHVHITGREQMKLKHPYWFSLREKS